LKVFFKKENMRVKETWWLSTFYSFAIQGLIRKLIQQLSYATSYKSANQYLHLAIRLFIASSGDYDPLTRDYVTLTKGKNIDSSYISDLQEAKNVVDQNSWASGGILSSADYLRNIFEDNGGGITVNNGMEPTRDVTRQPQESPPEIISVPRQGGMRETSCTSWSSFYPAPSGSRPYRPSSLSSMESSSDIASTRASPAPSQYHEPTPMSNFYFPGSSFGAAMQPTSQDPYHIPVDVYQTSQLAGEKGVRDAAEKFQFGQRRKERERERNEKIEKEQQRIGELERLLKDVEAEKEFYRCERDRFQNAILEADKQRQLVTETSPKPTYATLEN
jgi:hypothetical protein